MAGAIKALSLHQPWASLVASSVKSIETRSWSTSYRGPIAIHAAKTWNRDLEALCQSWPFSEVLPLTELPRGCIVALADLTGCKQATERTYAFAEQQCLLAANEENPHCEFFWGDFQPGRWLWRLDNVRPIDPVPARGKQGLWDWEIPSGLALQAIEVGGVTA